MKYSFCTNALVCRCERLHPSGAHNSPDPYNIVFSLPSAAWLLGPQVGEPGGPEGATEGHHPGPGSGAVCGSLQDWGVCVCVCVCVFVYTYTNHQRWKRIHRESKETSKKIGPQLGVDPSTL